MVSSALKRYGQPLYIVLIFLLVMLLAGVATGLLNQLWEFLISIPPLKALEIPPGSGFKLLLAVPFIVATVAVFIYPGRQNGGLSWKAGTDLEKADSDSRILILAAVFFLIPVGSQGAAAILEALSFRLYPNYELYDALMSMFSPTGHWLDIAGAIITVGLIGPFCEETVFRGFMLRGMLKNGMNLHIAVVLQGFLFGLVHGNPYQFSYAWPLGILLGYMAVYCRFGWMTIWVHSVTNLFAVASMYGYVPGLPEAVEPGEFLPAWFILGGCAMLAGGIYLYFRNMPSMHLATEKISAALSGAITGDYTEDHTAQDLSPQLNSGISISQENPVSSESTAVEESTHSGPENLDSGPQNRIQDASDFNAGDRSDSRRNPGEDSHRSQPD
tara:strand:- start:11939 stop:13096 length:1158 start_codon:yes stop_codon:yes gene_type:complete